MSPGAVPKPRAVNTVGVRLRVRLMAVCSGEYLIALETTFSIAMRILSGSADMTTGSLGLLKLTCWSGCLRTADWLSKTFAMIAPRSVGLLLIDIWSEL